jgi:hypothetical protein
LRLEAGSSAKTESWPGETRYGTHLILAALTTLLKNDEEH